jgi:hypothetical protein
MSAKTKVSALDHATHIAHTWVNDVAKEFDTDDREFAYGCFGHGCIPFAIALPSRRPRTLQLSCQT